MLESSESEHPAN